MKRRRRGEKNRRGLTDSSIGTQRNFGEGNREREMKKMGGEREYMGGGGAEEVAKLDWSRRRQ